MNRRLAGKQAARKKGLTRKEVRSLMVYGALSVLSLCGIFALAAVPLEASAHPRVLAVVRTTPTGTPGYIVTWTQTTGNCVSTIEHGTYPKPYPTGGSGVGTSTNEVSIVSGGGGPPLYPTGWGKADCAQEGAKFVATLQWDGGEDDIDPPGALIVRREVEAVATGDPGTYSVDCDLPAIYEDVEYEENVVGVSCKADVLLIIEDPGPNPPPISVSPSAIAEMAENSQTSLPNIGAGAELKFKITTYPIRLNVTGVLPDEETNRILIGQQLVATVDLGGYDPGSNPLWYTWQVEGGDPFESFVVGPTSGVLNDWYDVTNQLSSMDFYYADPDDSAITATVNVPGLGIQFQVDAEVAVEGPTFYHDDKDCGLFELRPDDSNPSEFSLYGVWRPSPPPDPAVETGVYFNAWVETPSEYRQGSDNGLFMMVQLMTDRSYVIWMVDGQLQYTDPPQTKGLDTAYPYGPFVSAGPKADPWLYWADRPRFESMWEYAKAVYDAEFELFVVYEPPGGASNVVPIAKIKWKAKGTADFDGSDWTETDDGSGFDGGITNWPEHPQWDRVIS